MIGLADCNNFFVSCERSVNSDLQGKAVIVMSNNDGCAVARSNEAKALGVKMGQPVHELKHLITAGKLIALSGNHLLYHDISVRIHNIFRRYVPATEDYSIDEAFLDVSGLSTQAILEIGENIKKACMDEEGIPVTIGFSFTKTLAKIATLIGKKTNQGIVILNDKNIIRKQLAQTSICDIWGIGRRICKRIYLDGIRTASDFIDKDISWVNKILGVNGLRVWNELNGTVCSNVEPDKPSNQSSISETRTFPNDISDYDVLRSKISLYATHCAVRLRKMNASCRMITVFLCTNRFHTENGFFTPSTDIQFNRPVSATHEIVEAAIKALGIIYKNNFTYKRGGIIVSKIVSDKIVQASLFDDDKLLELNQNSNLMTVIDNINENTYKPIIRLASQISENIDIKSSNGDGYSSSFGYIDKL